MTPQESQTTDLDLRELVMVLWRRRRMILGVMTAVLAMTALFVFITPPLYAGRAQVMLENPAPASPVDVKPALTLARSDNALVFSEVEVLKSRTLALRIIERLDLMDDPEFNPRLRGAYRLFSVFRGEEEVDSSAFKTLSVYKQQSKRSPLESLDQGRGEVVDTFLSRLQVRAVPGSFVIQLDFMARRPDKAALIANALVDGYIEQRLEEKFQAAQKISGWLDRRLGELRAQSREADARVERYRAAHKLIEGASAGMTAQQLSELNSQLVQAKAQLAEADARFEDLNKGKGAETMKAAPAVMDSRVIQDLKIDEAALLRSLSDLKGRYGEKHPAIIKARAELAGLRARIAAETGTVAQGVANDRAIAAARVASLEKELADVEQTHRGEAEAGVELRTLTQEAESSRAIFETFLESYKKTDRQELLQNADARVLSYAIVPSVAAFPNKPLFFSLALIASLFSGIALALLRERLDGTVHNGSMLETMTGYPSYGLVPFIEDRIKEPAADYVLDYPQSALAEAVRTLRMTINLRCAQRKPQVVMLTSSLPGEGKTTLSVWLARLAAKAGERVLLIDADLRRPAVHKNFARNMACPLSEYLDGRLTRAQIVHKDADTGLHMIMAGCAPADALQLLSGDTMCALLDSLREEYDLIVIDTPACLAVSDARALCSLSDLTLYAVAWEDTPREIVRAGLKQFIDVQAPLAFVLTHVDLARHARYRYGDPVYYYGKYNAA